jgi:cytochrome c oxidase subunit 2
MRTGDLPGTRGVSTVRLAVDGVTACANNPAVTRRSSGKRWRARTLVLVAGALALLLAACTQEYDYNSLAPAGPVADKQAELYTLVFWIAAGVFVLVEGALVFALFRFRRRSTEDTPKQIHGNTRLEIAWTIVPALLLAGVAVPTLGTIFDLSGCPDGSEQIEVVGHQWWWEVNYTEHEVTTANEIHIPTGEPVCVTLTSEDVIHSFWVPRLAGKQDMVPGRTIELQLVADRPGVYHGECAEYCGLSHGIMLFQVVAEEPADFDAWLTNEGADVAAQPPESISQMLTATCMTCHEIRGLQGAKPLQPAPDLTHVGSRRTIVAGWLENNPRQLARWLRDPPAVKPGSLMPDYNLTDEQIEDLVAYLGSLQ